MSIVTESKHYSDYRLIGKCKARHGLNGVSERPRDVVYHLTRFLDSISISRDDASLKILKILIPFSLKKREIIHAYGNFLLLMSK